MIELAHYSRSFWEKAGTWLHVERAEYYLSKYYRQILDLANAKKHGELCLKICLNGSAPPLEMFFAHESLALAFKETGESKKFVNHLNEMKTFLNQANESDKITMQDSLVKAEH